jgi:hypothetical protein
VTLGPDAALELSARLAAVAVAISSLELLSAPATLARGGLLAWRPVSMTTHWLSVGWSGRLFDRVLNGRWFTSLLVLRALAASAIILAPGLSWIQVVCVPVVFGGLVLSSLRNPYGSDGADQMLLVVFGALTLWIVGGRGETITTAAVWFIALQACLAYLTAGLAKLISPAWRSGISLPGVFGTWTYGSPRLGAWLLAHGGATHLLAWSVIGFECLFVLAVAGGGAPLVAALTVGASFHLLSALVMGLNGFLWAFVATYPAIVGAFG